MRTALLLCTLGASLLVAGPAGAASSYCSPTGDYCTQIFKRDGHRHFALRTFSHRGQVKFCVAGPNGNKTCRNRRLRKSGNGIYVARIRWDTNFPKAGRGTYRVRVYWEGYRLGPALTFRR